MPPASPSSMTNNNNNNNNNNNLWFCCRRRHADPSETSATTSFLPPSSSSPSSSSRADCSNSGNNNNNNTNTTAQGQDQSNNKNNNNNNNSSSSSTSNNNAAKTQSNSNTTNTNNTAAPETQSSSNDQNSSNKSNNSSAKAKSDEHRVCPITGAIGYCPMARPKGGRLPGEKLPELQVMLLLVWEDGPSKVSIGVYPHMSKHWEALELSDSASKEDIRTRFRQLSVKYHPDKNSDAGAKERFQSINDAYTALREVDGSLAFPWDANPDKQQTMTGLEALRAFGNLGKEAASQDPIKAQMMQHVVKESTECKVLIWESETTKDGMITKTTQADALCVDTRNGSNHLVKVFRRIVAVDPAAAAAEGDALDEPC